MEVTFLGTGTSIGIPVIGCSCPVCVSTDRKNKRWRPSVLLSLNEKHILIDTATDFRMQALIYGVHRINAVLYTHWHADHVFGLDDIRIFNAYQKASIPCFGNRETIRHLRNIYSYAFEETQAGGGKPKIDLKIIEEKFSLFGQDVEPVEVYHGKLRILAYRFDNMAYVTDCSEIPAASMEHLKGLKVLILGALRFTPHPTHFSLEEALRVVDILSPERVYLTHLSHAFDHEKTNQDLPSHISLAYDGLRLNL